MCLMWNAVLDLSSCRGQPYDDASNMVWKFISRKTTYSVMHNAFPWIRLVLCRNSWQEAGQFSDLLLPPTNRIKISTMWSNRTHDAMSFSFVLSFGSWWMHWLPHFCDIESSLHATAWDTWSLYDFYNCWALMLYRFEGQIRIGMTQVYLYEIQCTSKLRALESFMSFSA